MGSCHNNYAKPVNTTALHRHHHHHHHHHHRYCAVLESGGAGDILYWCVKRGYSGFKETVKRNLLPFFCLKHSNRAPLKHFSLLGRYLMAKLAILLSKKSTTTQTPCQRSQQLCGHRVNEVNHYADTVSMRSTTTRTPCQRSQQLRGHRVKEVNN